MSLFGPARWCDVRLVDGVLVLTRYCYEEVEGEAGKHLVTITFKCYGCEFNAQLALTEAPSQAEFDRVCEGGFAREQFGVADQLGHCPLTEEEAALAAKEAEKPLAPLQFIAPRVQASILPIAQAMLDNPGFYVAGDSRERRFALPLASMNGRVFLLAPDNELDPTKFNPTLTLSGPHRPEGAKLVLTTRH